MRRSAGNIDRAVELVRAALTWGHEVRVTIDKPPKGRATYAVHTDSEAVDAGDET